MVVRLMIYGIVILRLLFNDIYLVFVMEENQQFV